MRYLHRRGPLSDLNVFLKNKQQYGRLQHALYGAAALSLARRQALALAAPAGKLNGGASAGVARGSAGLGGHEAPARPALGGRPPLRPPSGGSGLRPLS